MDFPSAVSDYREQIARTIEATVFHSRGAYSWFGTPSPRLTARFERSLGQKNLQTWLFATLQSQLYSDFYCQGTATPSSKQANALVKKLR